MNANRCLNCGFLNFAAASTCKRCQAAFLNETPSAETAPHQSDPYSTNWQGSYEMAAAWPQPAYQPAYQPTYFPTPVAALPSRSKNGGANALLWVLLCGALVVAVGIGFLWKFNKSASGNYTWQEYQAPDNSFAYSMPTKPVEATQNITSDVQMHVLSGNMKQDGFYAIGYADYPLTAASKKVAATQILDAGANGAASNSGAQIVSKKSITLSGYPGLETDMVVPTSKVPGGGRMTCRIYWVTPRIYVACAGGPESSSVYASRAKFLDSFRFIK